MPWKTSSGSARNTWKAGTISRIIDLYQQPELARTQQLVVAPTLIKALPEPVRKILGDLSDTERVLAGLDLQKRAL